MVPKPVSLRIDRIDPERAVKGQEEHQRDMDRIKARKEKRKHRQEKARSGVPYLGGKFRQEKMKKPDPAAYWAAVQKRNAMQGRK